MVFIYTNCATLEDAEKLARIIIDKKMGSCVDFWPVTSVYHWEGKITKREQVMLMVTTLESKLEEINELIPDHTKYSTPLIAGVNIRRMNRPYKEWMMHEVA